MSRQIIFNALALDERNIKQIQQRHPTWSLETIIARALGFYATNLEKPHPEQLPLSASTVIEELFGT